MNKRVNTNKQKCKGYKLVPLVMLNIPPIYEDGDENTASLYAIELQLNIPLFEEEDDAAGFPMEFYLHRSGDMIAYAKGSATPLDIISNSEKHRYKIYRYTNAGKTLLDSLPALVESVGAMEELLMKPSFEQESDPVRNKSLKDLAMLLDAEKLQRGGDWCKYAAQTCVPIYEKVHSQVGKQANKGGGTKNASNLRPRGKAGAKELTPK